MNINWKEIPSATSLPKFGGSNDVQGIITDLRQILSEGNASYFVEQYLSKLDNNFSQEELDEVFKTLISSQSEPLDVLVAASNFLGGNVFANEYYIKLIANVLMYESIPNWQSVLQDLLLQTEIVKINLAMADIVKNELQSGKQLTTAMEVILNCVKEDGPPSLLLTSESCQLDLDTMEFFVAFFESQEI